MFKLFLAAVAAVVVVSVCLVAPTETKAQPVTLGPAQPNFVQVDTNVLTLTNNQVKTFIPGNTLTPNTAKVYLYGKGGLGIFCTVIQSNSGGQGIGFDVTGVAGTNANLTLTGTQTNANWTTTVPFWMYIPSNQTPGVLATNTFFTNWNATTFANVRAVQPTIVSNIVVGGGIGSNNVVVQLHYSQTP